MCTVPTEPDQPEPEQSSGHEQAGWLNNPAVRAAVAALRFYGEHVPSYGQMTRAQAERLLPLWVHYPELSPREVASVLAWFGQPEPEPEQGDGWISGSMGGNASDDESGDAS